ncbi:minor capsid protein [Capybara microvirus Cap3_SP_431]|nr:minor capsid protein [Capybara microvirus Cap3_SP_431]
MINEVTSIDNNNINNNIRDSATAGELIDSPSMQNNGTAWLGTALAIAGLVGGTISTAVSNRKNRDYAEEQQEKANEYNTPAQQRARLEEAGINPLAGGMSNSLSQPVSSPNQDPTANAVSLASMLNGLALQKSTIKLTDAQSEKMQAETRNIEAQTASTSATLPFVLDDLQQKLLIGNSSLQLSKEQLDYVRSQTHLLNKQIEWFDQQQNRESARLGLEQATAAFNRKNQTQLTELEFAKQKFTEYLGENEVAKTRAENAKIQHESDLLLQQFIQGEPLTRAYRNYADAVYESRVADIATESIESQGAKKAAEIKSSVKGSAYGKTMEYTNDVIESIPLLGDLLKFLSKFAK